MIIFQRKFLPIIAWPCTFVLLPKGLRLVPKEMRFLSITAAGAFLRREERARIVLMMLIFQNSCMSWLQARRSSENVRSLQIDAPWGPPCAEYIFEIVEIDLHEEAVRQAKIREHRAKCPCTTAGSAPNRTRPVSLLRTAKPCAAKSTDHCGRSTLSDGIYPGVKLGTKVQPCHLKTKKPTNSFRIIVEWKSSTERCVGMQTPTSPTALGGDVVADIDPFRPTGNSARYRFALSSHLSA